MNPARSIRSRATALWRALSVLVVVAGAVTCDSTTSLGHRVSLSVAPVFGRLSLSGFSGMAVDSVRLTVVRPPSDTIARQTLPFSPDSASIQASITVDLNSSHEQLLVLIEFLSNSQVVFTGADTVDVVAGTTTPAPAQVPISYVGPGKSIAAIHITPRDSGVTFGATVPFVITATDSSNANVAQFYVSWSTTRAGDTINAAGMFRPAATRGLAWVRARTPTGIWDSARIAVVPVANQIAIVSGDHQSASVSQALPQQLVVQVKAADNLPVVGAPVQFAAASGGGSVNPGLVATDTAGKAATTITLGSSAGVNTFTAGVVGAPSITVTSSDTAVNLHGVPATITKISGDTQTVAVGTAVPVRPQVLVKDVFGAVVAGASVQFSVQTGGGSVTGATVTTDALGLALVGSWTLGTTAGANTLRASIPSVPAVTPVTFTATGTVSGIPASLVKVAGDSQVAVPGAAVAISPAVKVLDALGVRVAGTSVQFAVTAGGGSTTGGTITSDTGGIARVGSWTLGTTAGTNTLRAAIPSVPAVTPVTFTATGMKFLTLSIVGSNVAGVGRTGLLAVKLSQPDAVADTVVVTSDSTQYLLVTQPLLIFAPGDTLKTVTDTGMAAGTAVVRATPVTTAIPPRYLAATPLAVPVTTNAIILPPTLSVPLAGTAPLPITLSSPAGASGVVITLTSTDTTKAKFTTPTVTVPASSTSVNATVQGIAVGTVTLVASNPNYAPAATGATVSSGPVIASTTVSPHFDTLTALADTFALSAQARNATGGPLSGTFTWVSRDTTLVKVSATGTAKAIANGSVYVVATEAGGTKDSALVTVQQRIATINVTPGNRNIYLTRNFTFTAAAVDGHGFAMPGATTFTWSSTAPAVASVDTAHTATNKVTAFGLGTAQIKATSGTVIGVANVSVLTPITRIAVVVDTVGAFKTDTASLASLGITRRYRAIAHDTLDAVIPGDTIFNWVSTNGAVAVIDSTSNAMHTTATSAANGVTTINAAAQGFTSAPGAYLTVAQVLASIDLAPAAPTTGISGRLAMTARGKDANGRFIAGGTFKYFSATPSVATVDSVTGVVVGVSLGTSNITATSGVITSNIAVVTVSASAPPAISFGRDTLSVGRGNTASIPILLSTPPASSLIVKLTSPAFAHWQGAVGGIATVTIPLGQTSTNATLVGDSAGTALVIASDSSGLGFAPDTAVAKVTANMRLTSSGYAINATDIVTTQVLLSDPSPAGGTFVTFNYSVPGIASVSPDPAFIPQGQLAADIQIRAVGAGATSITPNAIGVNGAPSSFTAYAPVISAPTLVRLGAGQYEPYYGYVQVPTYTNVAVPVTLTTSDTNVVTAPPSVTINGGQYYTYFTIGTKAVGSATITPSATGWTAANAISVVSTTPHVGICCGYTLNTTSPAQTLYVYAEDSTGYSHYRTSSLVVHLSSRTPAVIQVLDTVVTIPAGSSYIYSPRVIPAGLGGSAYVVVTAGGHTPDSVLITVIPPKLSLSWYSNHLGTGQYDQEYVYRPNASATPLVVSVNNSNPTAVTLPSADTIQANQNYSGNFNVVGNAPGVSVSIASATGFESDTGTYTVTTPRLVVACCGGSIYNFSPGTSAYAYVADSAYGGHYRSTPLVVSVHSSNTAKVLVDSTTLTIATGAFYTTTAHVTPVDTGSAYIVFTAAGHTPDSTLITVTVPKLYLALSHYAPGPSLLGRRQHFDPNLNGFYVSVPNTRTAPLGATITQKHANVDSLTTTSVTIATSTSYTYLDAYGLANGTDTLIVSAPGYLPDTAYIAVTTPRLYASGVPTSATTTNPPFTVYLYATDSTNNWHYTMDTVTVRAASSDTNVLRPGQAYFKIPKNTYYNTTTTNVVGPGTAHMSYADSNVTSPNRYDSTYTNNVSVTGPSFGISNGTPVLGMRQTGGPYSANVYTQNAVVSPLVVHLLSTSTRVVTVPDSVIIPTGYNYAYFPITAMDTVGTIQIQATATGYTQASTNVQVTQPKFVMYTATQLNTTSPRYTLYVYATDANGYSHYTTDSVTVTLGSSATSVASIDSSTITIVKGNSSSTVASWGPGVIGTAQLSATDTRAVYYKYNTATVNVAVVQPTVYLSWGTRYMGIGQYDDYAEAYTPDYMRAATTVNLTHVGTARTSTYANLSTTPITSVTIDSGGYYKYFRLAGLAAGTDTLVSSINSPLHNPDTAYTVVDLGRVDPFGGWPATLSLNGTDSVQVTLYTRDQNQSTHNVLAATTFTLAPNANIQFVTGGSTSTVITSIQVPAGAQSVPFWVKGVSQGTGSATISATNYQTYNLPTITVGP